MLKHPEIKKMRSSLIFLNMGA